MRAAGGHALMRRTLRLSFKFAGMAASARARVFCARGSLSAQVRGCW